MGIRAVELKIGREGEKHKCRLPAQEARNLRWVG